MATATLYELFGSYTTLTVTSLQSMAASATAGWQSDRVDLRGISAPPGPPIDVEVYVSLTTANTAPANSKAATVYVVPWIYDGSSWHPADQGTATLPTGTQGTTTIASPNSLAILKTLPYTTQQMTMQWVGTLSNALGATMPDGFSLIVTDDTGAALSTGCVVAYKTVNLQSQ